MNDRTIAALNQVTEQLARIAAAVEDGTTYTPRHAAPTLTPTYAIDDPTGGDTWDSMSEALAEISLWGESARREALDAGFIVRWQSPWLPVKEHVTPPDDEVVDADVVDSPKVWTVEELDALPDGWTVYDRDGDPWKKAVTRPDGTSLWRCCQGGAFRNSQAVIRWINPEPFVGHALTIDELNEAPCGAIVVDSLNDSWTKTSGDWVRADRNERLTDLPLTSKLLHQYGPIREATR